MPPLTICKAGPVLPIVMLVFAAAMLSDLEAGASPVEAWLRLLLLCVTFMKGDRLIARG